MEDRKSTLRWLDGLSSEDDYETHLAKRLGGTCNWIFTKPAYNNWIAEDTLGAKVLWIHGAAGFGKTVLCASIAEHLKRTTESPLAYFFCSSDLEAKRDPLAIVRSWVAQVVSQDGSAYQLASELSQKAVSPRATNSEIWQLFKSMASVIPLCSFIVDGLDECSQSANSRMSFLNALRESTKMSTSRILVVSRVEVDIQLSMSYIIQEPGCLFYEHGILGKDVQPDIDSFSRSVVDQKLPRKSEIFRAELAGKMAEKCSGMFLWIRLQESQLRSGKNARQLQQIVASMPTGLDCAYERDLNRILKLEDSERNRAINILRFIMFALRPLTVHEITEALVVVDNDCCNSFQIDELPDVIDEEYIQDEISRFCSTLLQIREPEDGSPARLSTVHFVHFSVKEYLLVKGNDLGIPALSQFQINDENLQHDWFARICLRYLDYNEVWDLDGPEAKMRTMRPRNHPFIRYAARFWHLHLYRHTVRSDDTNAQIIKFFRPGNPNWRNWQDAYETATQMNDGDIDVTRDNLGSPLYYAASFGFLNAIHYLHEEGIDINATGGRFGNALQAAVVEGHYPVAKALLDFGANVNMLGGQFCSSLHASAAIGDQYITELLLESGSDVFCQNHRGETPLHLASEGGNILCVKLLLENKSNPNSQCHLGHTPLYFAAFNGHADVARLLLIHGAEVDLPEYKNHTSLHIAAQNGHRAVAEILLSHGAQVNAKEIDNSTPIHFAVGNDDAEMVELLLENEVKINETCHGGLTPLHLAVERNNKKLVELLIDNGANLNAICKNGFTSLHLAVRKGFKEILNILLLNGADVECMDESKLHPFYSAIISGNADVVEILLSRKATANFVTQLGSMPLFLALATQAYTSVVELLLEKGVDINATNPDGWTPLCYAANHGRVQDVATFLKHKADINKSSSNFGTPLHSASEYGHVEIVRLLLDNGAEILEDKIGFTPLHRAAMQGHRAIVEMLLNKGVNININTAVDGLTSLHLAAKRGHSVVAHLLLSRGADIDVVDREGCTPLHYAAYYDQKDLVESFLGKGAYTNFVDIKVFTPLHYAAYYDHKDLVKLFLDKGADTTIVDNCDGRTPLHIATIHSHRDLVELLLNKERGTGLAADAANDIAEERTSGELLPSNLSLSVADNKHHRLPLHWAVLLKKADIVELLIDHGANPNLHDAFGLTSLDLAYHHEKVFSKLGSARLTYKPTENRIRRVHLMTTIIRISGQTQMSYLGVLGRCLLNLGDIRAGSTLLEQIFKGNIIGTSYDVICDVCGDEVTETSRNWYMCSVCHNVDVCERCMPEGLDNPVMLGCSQHEFIKISLSKEGGSTPGTIGDQGLTILQWLQGIHTRYRDELIKEESELRKNTTACAE